MSMALDTSKHGVTRPLHESCEERGKRLKLKAQQKSDSEPKQERMPIYDWESKRSEDLKLSDFSMFDEDPNPFVYGRYNFEYKNRAHIQKEEAIKVAMAEYIELSRNLSPFDAIPVPKIAQKCGSGVQPIPITNDIRIRLTPLCKLALDYYNANNQGANFVFDNIVKTTWRPCGVYYITFEAREEEEDPSNSPATTFQAHVLKGPGAAPNKVISCAIKT